MHRQWKFALFLFLMSCGLRVDEAAKKTGPFVIQPEAAKECGSINYKAVFSDWFYAEDPAARRARQKAAKAVSCVRSILRQISNSVRGAREDSLTKEELRIILRDPLTIHFLKDMGVPRGALFIHTLTSPKNLDRLFEIKNFTVEVIRSKGRRLSSEEVCNVDRDRLYKWEIEEILSFLTRFSEWLIRMGESGDRILISLQRAGSVEKSLLASQQYLQQYLLPALQSGFAHDLVLSSYLKRAAFLLSSAPKPDLFENPRLFQERREKAAVYLKAAASFALKGQMHGSPFMERPDIQLMAAGVSFSGLLLSIYDKNKDLSVSKREFHEGSVCLEDFLLPLFGGSPAAFHYFLEFQAHPKNQWWHYYWDKSFGDRDFNLFMDDFARIAGLLFQRFFPYKWFRAPAAPPSEAPPPPPGPSA